MKYAILLVTLLIGLVLGACGSKTVVPTSEPGKAGGETPLVMPPPTQAR